jgi:hypothetical protein
MECTKCHIRKELYDFSLKNKIEGIYYLYCDKCRQQTNDIQKKYKDKAKEKYELNKIINNIECDCGITFVCFREFHMYRHLKSKHHENYMIGKNRMNTL